MRLKSKIVLTAMITAMYCGSVTYGQNQAKPVEPVKPAIKAPAGAVVPQKPVEAVKKPLEGVNRVEGKPIAPPASVSADETAIRTSADSFAKLYNEHDSKGLAALFAAQAEVIDENEQVVKGREAIEQAFADVFKANPKSSMQIDIESVRILTPQMAIEEGTVLSKDSPDDPETETTYVAVHVKSDGKWLLACVRDWAVPSVELTPHDHLLELGWLVGEWVEESDDSTIHTVCKWHDNDNFLMQEFKIHIGGDVAMSGTMRIGWDAVSKQFKSWVFDSRGGHSVGLWHHVGDVWVVKSSGATARGETASATNVYRQIDGDTLGWSSFHRVTDGIPQDDIDEIVIKRRPPTPVE